jgi:hypothetical protein
MRYIIVDTWNGQGYSDSGIIDDTTYTDMSEDNARHLALESAREHFADRYLPTSYHHEVKIRFQQDALCVEDGEDNGAIHFIKATDSYGVLIHPQVNEVKLLSKREFIDTLDTLSSDGELQGNLKADNITWGEWIDDLYSEGHNDGHGIEYFILYKL